MISVKLTIKASHPAACVKRVGSKGSFSFSVAARLRVVSTRPRTSKIDLGIWSFHSSTVWEFLGSPVVSFCPALFTVKVWLSFPTLDVFVAY